MCYKCQQQKMMHANVSPFGYDHATGLNPEFGSWLPSFDQFKEKASSLFNTGKELLKLKYLIATGNISENSLTNILFYDRHPELQGAALSRNQYNYTALSNEWIQIRDTVVRPQLGVTITPVPADPKGTPVQAPPASASGNAGVLSLQNIINAMVRKGYTIFSEPGKLNIVGVRSSNTTPNKFDDSINVFYKDDAGNTIFKSYPATTDPGSYYLQNPMNPAGTAIVKPGQYKDSHQIGVHRGEYTALTQKGTITVYRDANKDNKFDFLPSSAVQGVYGINIHRASATGTSTDVGKYSAGCQVIANIQHFNEFMGLCQAHSKLYGNSFTYTLLEQKDLY